MTRYSLQRRAIDKKALLRRSALESDTEHIVSEPGVYELDGVPTIIYGKLPKNERMLWALRTIEYQTSTRTAGLKTTSRIFGFRPRIALRSDFCSITSMALDFPKQHKTICEFGQDLARLYEACAPETYRRHCEEVKAVLPDWMIPSTPFTSGIVNENNPLKYHLDSGNFEGMFSCMAVFRKECEGGYLSVPEFNTRFFLDDHSYLLFDGQALLHGVTPLKTITSDGYRYSVVYYALKSMVDCGTRDEEIKRIRVLKRTREKNRL